MKNVIIFCLMAMMLTLTSCEVIGDIFSAGVYTGVFIVVIVIVLIIWLIARMGRR